MKIKIGKPETISIEQRVEFEVMIGDETFSGWITYIKNNEEDDDLVPTDFGWEDLPDVKPETLLELEELITNEIIEEIELNG